MKGKKEHKIPLLWVLVLMVILLNQLYLNFQNYHYHLQIQNQYKAILQNDLDSLSQQQKLLALLESLVSQAGRRKK